LADSAVSVKGLVKHYGETRAVDDVSFEVNRGEIFALLGPNGAGKTTTVEILEGVRRQTGGRVEVLGTDMAEPGRAKEVKRRIGVLPQDFNAFSRLTVNENLEFFAGIYQDPTPVRDLLDLMGIADVARTKFSRLSGGLKQRVGIAMALVNDPEVIFLDEPTTGLDPEARRATWNVIRDLRSKGKTTVLTTHYMEEAGALADRIGIMVKGKLAALDTTDGLLEKFGSGKAIVFKNGGDQAFGTLRRYFDSVSMEGSDVVLPFERLRDLEVALTALVGRGLDLDVSIRSPSVEDVFLKLVGHRVSESGEAN
jgi:ABC-2 type transport system ATP-binding protein